MVEIFTVDAFTAEGKLFTGNPAAVCLVRGSALPDATMQAVAAEINLSETAFVRADEEEGQLPLERASWFHLRWFTPTCEVPLCGHATLSAAAVLFGSLRNPSLELRFRTASGVLRAKLRGGGEGATAKVTLDFPQNPCTPEDRSGLGELIEAAVGETPVKEVQYSASTGKLLLRIEDGVGVEALRLMRPDIGAMVRARGPAAEKIRGVIITMIGGGGGGPYDFYSRYFAPWVGIPEDPVTGSAHTVLGPYWGRELRKTTMRGFQCSPRGGEMEVTLDGEGRVHLTGAASVVLEGKLNLQL